MHLLYVTIWIFFGIKFFQKNVNFFFGKIWSFYVAVGAVCADVTTDTTVLTVAVVAEVVAFANVVVVATPEDDMWAMLQQIQILF